MAKRPTYLRIDNPAEDVPRRIQGTGRTPRGGTWGLVILPHEQRSMLMVADKRKRGQPRSFRTWSSLDAASGEGRVDVVGDPEADTDPDESMKALHTMGHMKLGKRTDITLKGRWKGTFRWAAGLPADGVPIVELTRQVGSYVTLTVRSFTTEAGHPAWRWMLKRDARWFASDSGDFGEALTLKGAVATALRQMEGVVGEACTVRDTRRRGALQTSYTGRVGRVREAPVTGRGVDRFKPSKRRKTAASKPKTTTAKTAKKKPCTSCASKAASPVLAVVRPPSRIDYNDDRTAERRAAIAKHILDGFRIPGRTAPPPAGSTDHAKALVAHFLLRDGWSGTVRGGRKVRGQDRYTVEVEVQGSIADRRWAHLAAALESEGIHLLVNGGVHPTLPDLGEPAQPSPSQSAAPGSPLLDVATLKKRTAKHAEAWKAKLDEKRAKSWVRSAFHHMGLGSVELDAKPESYQGQVVVKLTSLGAVDSDTYARLSVIEEARPVGLFIEVPGGAGIPAPTAPPTPRAPQPVHTTPGGVSTWPDVVAYLDTAYAEAGIPAQPAPGGLSRRDMARAIADALRTGHHHELLRTSQKTTTKAVAKLLGLKGKSRPRSNKAWAALFQGCNLLPHLTGTLPAPTAGTTGYTPVTARDVRRLTQDEAAAFRANPTPTTAKKWVAAALRLADLWDELGASDVTVRKRLVEGVFVARIVLFTSSTDHPEEDRADMAAVVAAAPEGLVIEEWRWSDGVFPEQKAPSTTSAPSPLGEAVRKRTANITSAFDGKATSARAKGWVRAAMKAAGLWDDTVELRAEANPLVPGRFSVRVLLASATTDHMDADLAAINAIEAEAPAGLHIVNWIWRDQQEGLARVVREEGRTSAARSPAPKATASGAHKPKPKPKPRKAKPRQPKPRTKADKNAIIAAAAKAEVSNQMALFFGSPQ